MLVRSGKTRNGLDCSQVVYLVSPVCCCVFPMAETWWKPSSYNLNGVLAEMAQYMVATIRDSDEAKRKPVQFHTGLGDNDINLVLANPAHLQPMIEYYKEVDFVLLHSSYPYTREAGYLASVYPNVFVDLGGVY